MESLTLKKIERSHLDWRTIYSLEQFIKSQKSAINTVFLSHVWAERIRNAYGFEYQWMVFIVNGDIAALHLSFFEYRGREKIAAFPLFIQKLITPIVKKIAPYNSWRVLPLIDHKISVETRKNILEAFINNVKNLKSVRFSPIPNECCTDISSIKWSTYRFDFNNNSYADVYSRYSRSLKRSLKKINNNSMFAHDRLDFSNRRDVCRFVDWVRIEQKNTGKAFIYEVESMMRDKRAFTKEGYIYEIFLLKHKEVGILGSMVLYGSKNLVTEAEANASIESKNLKIFVHDYLRDAIVQFCLSKGVRFYDLAGFNPGQDISKKEEGIKFAKQKFNAKEVSYKILSW